MHWGNLFHLNIFLLVAEIISCEAGVQLAGGGDDAQLALCNCHNVLSECQCFINTKHHNTNSIELTTFTLLTIKQWTYHVSWWFYWKSIWLLSRENDVNLSCMMRVTSQVSCLLSLLYTRLTSSCMLKVFTCNPSGSGQVILRSIKHCQVQVRSSWAWSIRACQFRLELMFSINFTA